MKRILQIAWLRLLPSLFPGLWLCNATLIAQSTMDLQLRSIDESGDQVIVQQQWEPSKTAFIVCDVWDYHHCLNAVGRIEQFVPRLNQVLVAARARGALIIHAPSDCMEAYQSDPARLRAIDAPPAADAPADIDAWCSSIPSEEQSVYPIDQSDGGEDDDPVEHAEWAKKLVSLGRNPQAPWKEQSALITIDQELDYISDRGREVWNILQQRDIQNVVLVGVHTNMCVLGRPFGLRQMVRGKKNVVLMRDMTDTMYNPQRWPYVSHFEGTRRIISHIERLVCPTISSDQIIGGDEFRFPGDRGRSEPDGKRADLRSDWVVVAVPERQAVPTERPSTGPETVTEQPRWFRCVVRIPVSASNDAIGLICGAGDSVQAWINGRALPVIETESRQPNETPAESTIPVDEVNLIVIRTAGGRLTTPPRLRIGTRSLLLAGQWQTRIGDDPSFRKMPLPAQFGAGSDIVFDGTLAPQTPAPSR